MMTWIIIITAAISFELGIITFWAFSRRRSRGADFLMAEHFLAEIKKESLPKIEPKKTRWQKRRRIFVN